LDLERFAPEALSETGQLLVPLFSSSPLGIAFCDKGLRFRAINNTLAAMNGIPAEAHLGKTVRDVVGPVASQVEPAFKRVFATGEKFSIEVAGKLPKRAEWGYWIEDYYPIRDRQGKVKQVCVTVIEISRIKKLEESLDFLQRHEEKLWFWGVDRAEDMGFSAEFLREAGLRLDRRLEFPRKGANLALAPERSVPAFILGPVRRGLAESMEAARPVYADAGD